MITIDQLLESVDLDFEPRFVTKDPNGMVWLWETKPVPLKNGWGYSTIPSHTVGFIKLVDFENKPWQECIYEVPRKKTLEIYKFDSSAIDTLYNSNPEKFKKFICGEFVCKLNEVIDAVNELKRAKNE